MWLFELPCFYSIVVCDESKTHLFLSPFFKNISGLKVQFNVRLCNSYPELYFAEI